MRQNGARCARASSVPCAIAGRVGRAERAECSPRKVAKVPGTRGGRARARVQSALYIWTSRAAPEDLVEATNQCLVCSRRRRRCPGAGGWSKAGRPGAVPASPSNRGARTLESGGAAKEPVEGACGDGVQHSTMVEVPDRRVVLRIGRDEFECLKSDRRGGAPMAHHELVQRFP